MTSTPPEPLDEPVDTGAQESAEEADNPGGDGSDFLESGTLRGSPGDEGNR